MTGLEEDVAQHRSSIRDLVRQSVDRSWASDNTLSPRKRQPATKGPTFSPIKRIQVRSPDTDDEGPNLRERVNPGQGPSQGRPNLRRLSSSSDSTVMALDQQSETSSVEEKEEDDAYDEDLGVKQWTNKEFVYSKEVNEAIKKIRDRRNQKSQFTSSEVHIFNLPQIIQSGTPRIPFTPSIQRDLPKLCLPEPALFEQTQKAKKKKKQYTEDEFGMYLYSWRRDALGVNPDIVQPSARVFSNTQADDDD